jgi:GrpB-like predicted nucleotidyltransferase (UPF0157 family)
VPSASDVRQAIERLEAVGYVHRGELGVRGREAFLWPPGEPRHHLYVFVEGSSLHLAHLRFRDHLRRSPKEVNAYSLLKRRLAASHERDRVAYTEAKSEFIERVLANAAG